MLDRPDGSGQASVVVVEDDAIVRAWVRDALAASEFWIAGEAASVASALELVPRRLPRLLLVDYRLPDGVGTEFLKELRRQGNTASALLMTARPEEGLNEAARFAGAQGTVLKSGDPYALLGALRTVAAGGEVFDARHPQPPPTRRPLSPREREVLALVASGATNQQIATSLGLGSETVKTVVARIYVKLGVGRRAEAVSKAMTEGLL